MSLSPVEPVEYTYLTVPAEEDLRSCVGLVLAGMAIRARIGIGGLEEAIEALESLHSAKEPTSYRFSLKDEAILAEVEERTAGSDGGASRWRTVVELIS
jgi:hypothetical protein